MAESKEELKSLLMRVKKKSRKVGLKLNIHKTNKGGRWEWKEWDFIFLGSKIIVDGDCSHEIKRHRLLGRKVMTNPDSILKSRDITLQTKVCLVKAMVFPVIIYEYESWTIKKAEHWSIDVFKLWCWTRLLRVPWTARRSNHSILKEINPEYSSEGLMLKLKLQYFGHLMGRADSLEKTLMLGKIEGRRRSGWQSITDSMDMSLSKLWEIEKDRESLCFAVHGVTKSQTRLSNWTTTNPSSYKTVSIQNSYFIKVKLSAWHMGFPVDQCEWFLCITL